MQFLKYTFLILFCFLFGLDAFGQNVLPLQQAIDNTLNNNYGIKVSRNDLEIAENNTDKSLFGYKPAFSGSASLGAANGSRNTKFSNGMEQPAEGFSWGPSASVGVNYTILDKERDMNLNQIKESLNLNILQVRQTIENNLLQVYNDYFQIARLTENLVVQQQTLAVDRKRLERTQYQFQYGQGIRLDILNAEVDIKRDSINYLNLKQQLENAKRNLNVTMGRTVTSDYVVDTTVVYNSSLTLEGLLNEAKQNNVNIKIIDANTRISNLDLEVINAAGRPTLGANASYDYSLTLFNPNSFLSELSNRGLNVGLNLNWNLPAAGSQKIRRQNNKIAIATQQLQREQVILEIERDLVNAWQNYQNALYVLEVESSNLETNKLNFERTEQQFKGGQVSSLEFRQAQLNLLNAATNFSVAKYDAKVIEFQLLQLSGNIIE